MALKDSDVVKSYAMVSVERVQDAVRSEDDANPDLEDCLRAYVDRVKASTKRTLKINYNAVLPDSLGGADSDSENDNKAELKTVSGTISDIRTAVVDGNSVYYIALDGKPVYYTMAATDDNSVVILNVGDKVKINFKASDDSIIKAKSIKK